MKKLLSVILSASVLCSIAPFYAAADPEFEKTNITVEPADGSEKIEAECYIRNDLPEIPYIDTKTYLDQLFVLDKEPENTGDGVYAYQNGGFTMTVDTQLDTVSFDYLEGFLASNPKNEPLWEDFFFIEDGVGTEPVGEVQGVEFDLAKYDIDIVELDGAAYLPFCTLADIFCDADYTMVYKKDRLKMMNAYNLMGSKGRSEDERSSAYAEFCYDELCFSMDCTAGKPAGRGRLSESICGVGFDKTLETYNTVTPRVKELLLADNAEDYFAGLMLLQYYLDDGGHTHLDFSIQDKLNKYGIPDAASAARKIFGENAGADVDEIIASQQAAEQKHALDKRMAEEKAAAYANCEKALDFGGAALYRTGDTFIFDIGYFSYDMIEAFKQAMDHAEENGAKYFIVDVTDNAGGYPEISIYMLSLMSDKAGFIEKNIVSGNMRKFTGRIDKNLDGKFDEKDDEVSYSFKCAVLGGARTYSCPNEFTCFAKDAGVCVIGEKTPGGSCCVVTRVFPNGTSYNISGYCTYICESGCDPDLGAEPDVAMPASQADYKGFYNFNEMRSGIAGFYGDELPDTDITEGDIDGDGEITASDALMVLRISAGL